MVRQQTYIKGSRYKVVMKIAPFPSETRAMDIIGLYYNICIYVYICLYTAYI